MLKSPLSFLEFLEALQMDELKNFVEELNTVEPLPPNLHEKLLGHFKEYLFVGGMPEAVAEYIEQQDLTKVREIQEAILNAYSLDFAKYAPNGQIMKIDQVWGSIRNQLAKENKKFIYSVLRQGRREKRRRYSQLSPLPDREIEDFPVPTNPIGYESQS